MKKKKTSFKKYHKALGYAPQSLLIDKGRVPKKKQKNCALLTNPPRTPPGLPFF